MYSKYIRSAAYYSRDERWSGKMINFLKERESFARPNNDSEPQNGQGPRKKIKTLERGNI